MKAKKVKETPEQAAERKRAEADRFRAIQSAASDRTAQFQRLTNPRSSLFGGGAQGRTSLFGGGSSSGRLRISWFSR